MDDKKYPVSIDLGIPESAAPPEPPPAGAMVWLRKNLFRSVGSGILSIGMILAILGAGWSIMSFAFEETRQWRAVAQNSRLLMVQAYPQDDFLRVWIAAGLILVIGALSLAVYGESGKTSWKRIGRSLTGFGLIIAIMLASPLVEGRSERYLTVVIALVIAAIGIGIPRMLGEERAKQDSISTPAVIGVLLGLVTVALWLIEAPIQGTNEAGNNVDEWVPIATSTRLPWTIILLLTIGAYPLGRRLKDAYPGLRQILTGWWILASPLLVLVVLRKPNIDWDLVVAFDIPVLIGGAIVGWLALQWMGAPGRGEEGRIVAGLLTVGSLILLFVPFPEAVSSPATVKWIILLLGAFALLSPTFGGSPAAVRSFQWVWVLTVFAVVFFFRLGGSETLLLRPGSTVPFAGGEFLGGLALTAVLAIFAIGLSFPIGVMLALGRSSTLPIFRTVSTAYIELIRSVPLITWLFAAINFGDFFLPEGLQSIDNVVRAIGAMTFFSAAYLAENVRGGLQSLSRGQYEAADALGMSVVQKTALITLPQALRAVIPALVGQVIALFKDTSLVAIIGLFDLLYIGKTVIPGQSAFLGSFMEAIIAVAIIYWPFAFAMSRASMRLEKKLGLGTR